MEKVQEILDSAQRGESAAIMRQITLGAVYRIGKVHRWPLAERKCGEISPLPFEIIPIDEVLFRARRTNRRDTAYLRG